MTYWDISTAFYSGKSFYIGSQSTSTLSFCFKPDGFIMYIIDYYTNIIFQYNLSVPCDISTAVYSGKSFDVGKQDSESIAISFNPDGSIMYMLGHDNNTVFRYDLNGKKHTPWDISSAVYNRIKLDVSAQNYYSEGLFFSSDGSKFYTLDSQDNTIHQYNLSVPWDITSGLYSGKSFIIVSPDLMPRDIFFSPDGTKFYTVDIDTRMVYQYTLSIPWDLSTAFYSNKYLDIRDPAIKSYGLSFSILGSEMYILGNIADTIYQYTLPETPPPPPKKEASRTGIYSFKTLS